MNSYRKISLLAFAGSLALALCMSAIGQQKPQWLPGQVGLNAGIMPSPGFS